jgi:acetyltransferase-like isoleucine patch superfamily enzyme
MNLARVITEAAPSIRWHIGKILTKVLYRKAFLVLGEGTVIVRPLQLRGLARVAVGARCAIYEGVWLQAEPGANLTIGDDVYLGHDVHLHAIDDVTIGAGTMMADGVLVNAAMHLLKENMHPAGTGQITIGAGCFIGQRTIVLGGVTIGDGATIGAGSVVTRDVPAGTTAAGVPARVLHEALPAQIATSPVGGK